MAGWHHPLNGRYFEWTPGVGDGQGGLVCCDSWGRKESETTEWLNWTELNWKSLQMVTTAVKLRHLLLGRIAMSNQDSILKSRDVTLPTKICPVKAACFSSSHIWMWDLDYKESWAPKNWCFWTVVLEETLESPLDCTKIQAVHSKGNQSWIFIGRTEAEAQAPNFGHLVQRINSFEKTLMLGEIQGRRRKG